MTTTQLSKSMIRETNKLINSIFLTLNPNLYPYIYQKIGRYAYGAALERENKEKYYVARTRYNHAYTVLATDPHNSDFLDILPKNLVYDRHVNYRELQSVLYDEWWTNDFDYNRTTSSAIQILYMTAYARYWQNLESLDELLYSKDIFLSKVFDTQNPNKYSHLTVFELMVDEASVFKTFTLLLPRYIEDTKVITADDVIINDDFVIGDEDVNIIVPGHFSGTIHDLNNLVRQYYFSVYGSYIHYSIELSKQNNQLVISIHNI